MSLGMLGKYEKLDVLGNGATGIVYLAKDTLLNRQVAIKEVDVHSGDELRYLEEARLLDRLHHPNIVRIHGVDRIGGKIVIDMEYVRGSNLQQILRSRGKLPIQDSLEIAVQVLSALTCAHEQHIIHRDIKPGNILMSDDGTVKLADFGQADILATNAYAFGAGTYAYMAPEDFAPEGRSDAQSDLWAVGVTLYEMLTGQRPFYVSNPRNPFAWKQSVEESMPTPLGEYIADVPLELQEALTKSLNPNKEDRFLSAADFRLTLMKILDPNIYSFTKVTDNSEHSWVTPPPRVGFSQIMPTTGDNLVRNSLQLVSASPEIIPPPVQPSMNRLQVVSGKQNLPNVRVLTQPGEVVVNHLRIGDSTERKVRVKLRNTDARTPVLVKYSADWLTVTPEVLTSSETLVISIDTETIQYEGLRQTAITLESPNSSVVIPVHANILPSRPSFNMIAHWYIPAMAMSILPMLIVAFCSPFLGVAETGRLAPVAAVLSTWLATQVLLICFGVDSGPVEKIASGILSMASLSAFVTMVYVSSTKQSPHLAEGINVAGAMVLVLMLTSLLQLFTFRAWKFWLFILISSSMLADGTLFGIVLNLKH